MPWNERSINIVDSVDRFGTSSQNYEALMSEPLIQLAPERGACVLDAVKGYVRWPGVSLRCAASCVRILYAS